MTDEEIFYLNKRFYALLVLITTQDLKAFSDAYHFLTNNNGQSLLRGFYKKVVGEKNWNVVMK